VAQPRSMGSVSARIAGSEAPFCDELTTENR
jgi:hypothetical protein